MQLRKLLVGCVLLAGCGGATEGSLRTRAAFDLDCSEDKLTLVDLDSAEGVKGCGKQATYIKQCDQLNGCKWIMNSDMKPKGESKDDGESKPKDDGESKPKDDGESKPKDE